MDSTQKIKSFLFLKVFKFDSNHIIIHIKITLADKANGSNIYTCRNSMQWNLLLLTQSFSNISITFKNFLLVYQKTGHIRGNFMLRNI